MDSLNARRLLGLAILASVLGFALLIFPYGTPRVRAAATTIDHFDDSWSFANSVAGTSAYSYTNYAGILGGQREVTVTNSASSGSGDITFRSNSPSGTGSYSTDADVLGSITLTYDGSGDSGAAGVNPTGLGGVDLSATAIVVGIYQADYGGSMTINYWSSATECSTLTRSVPGSLPPGGALYPIVFRFRDFGTCGGYSSAAVSNTVGAVQLVVSSPTKSADIVFHVIASANLDFGDAPTSYRTNYNATPSSSGPYHVISTLRLGSTTDAEEGQSVGGTNAVIDDNTTSDDEDGVTRVNTTAWTNGNTVALSVTVSAAGCLYGWFDWSDDGVFDDGAVGSSDRIISTTVNSGGTAQYSFTSQANTSGNQYYARFRLYPFDQDGTCNSVKAPEGNPAFGGEVEDYRFGWMPTAVTLTDLTATTNDVPWLPIAGVGIVIAAGLGVFTLRRK